MFRKATAQDVPQIMEIIRETVVEMQSYNNPQWDEHYPAANDFLADIQESWLYVLEDSQEIIGFVCLNNVSGKSYPKITWQDTSTPLVMRRMGVKPSCRRRGVAKQLLQHIETMAKDSGISVIKMDTFCRNDKMNAFVKKNGFIHRGTVCIWDIEEPFYFYEKNLK